MLPTACASSSAAVASNALLPRCKVCADTAGCGTNFGCTSCESCKAFFRRCCGAAAGQPLQCPFSGQCRITTASRRACQACRLAKCIQAGMRKELVDVWKRAKRGRQEGAETTAAAAAAAAARVGGGSSKQQGGRQKGGRRRVQTAADAATNDEKGTAGGCCHCRCEEQQPKETREQGTQTVAEHAVALAELDDGTTTAWTATTTTSSSTPTTAADDAQSTSEHHQHNLTTTTTPMAMMSVEERALLDELIRANSVMDTPLRVPAQLLPLFNLTLTDALRVSEWGMRRMVTMFKQLSAFRSLSQPDQIVLLRAGLVELLILRGAMAFDPVNEVWRHAVAGQHQVPFMLRFNVLPDTEQHHQEHKRFLYTFGEQWRTNRDVMLIMHAIVLFSPPRASAAAVPAALQAPEQVQAHRQRYCALLHRYLCADSAQRTEWAFAHLMAKLDELGHLNASFQRIYVQQSRIELLEEPLLKELFAGASAGAGP